MALTLDLYVESRRGWLRYRRVARPELRPFLPARVPEFSVKPGRWEFCKSLRIPEGDVRRGNREAMRLDGIVQKALDAAQIAFEEAERAKAAATSPTSPPGLPAPLLSPEHLLAALERWMTAAIQRLELDAFNGRVPTIPGSDALSVRDGRYSLQQFVLDPRGGHHLKIPAFDRVLVEALADQGIQLPKTHGCIPSLRPAFAEAWQTVIRKSGDLKATRWALPENGPSPGLTMTTPAPSPSLSPPPSSAQAAEPLEPFLANIDKWDQATVMKGRQKSVYQSDIEQFSNFIENAALKTVSGRQMQRWVQHLAETGLTSKTINRKLTSLRSYWRYLLANEHAVKRDLFSDLVIPREARARSRNQKPWPPAQVVALREEALRSGRAGLAQLIEIAAYTGARIESICTLRAEDVHDVDGITCFHFSDKTEAGIRDVPVHSRIAPMISKLCRDVGSDGYLLNFGNPNRYGERSPALSKQFGRLKTALGFDRSLNFHSIRRTVATLFECAECPENVAANIIGHDKPTMTYGLYSGGSSIAQRAEWLEKAITYPAAQCDPAGSQDRPKMRMLRSSAKHGA